VLFKEALFKEMLLKSNNSLQPSQRSSSTFNAPVQMHFYTEGQPVNPIITAGRRTAREESIEGSESELESRGHLEGGAHQGRRSGRQPDDQELD